VDRESLFSAAPPGVPSVVWIPINRAVLQHLHRTHLPQPLAGDCWLSRKYRILIVDRSAEARQVLRTVLERNGNEAVELDDSERASEIMESSHPDLIVLDEENDFGSKRVSTAELGLTASRNGIPIVVLGTKRRNRSPLPTGHLIAKPYHYAPLIRRIEEILGNRG